MQTDPTKNFIPPTASRTCVLLLSGMETIHRLWLPMPPSGKHYFPLESGGMTASLSFEARGQSWFACCLPPAQFRLSNKICTVAELQPNRLLLLTDPYRQAILYAEEVEDTGVVFHNYRITPGVSLHIGRTSENDIIYENTLVSKLHATLFWDNGLHVQDEGSTNGTYVNGKRVDTAVLAPGDTLQIMGLQIIVGIGFLSINDGNKQLHISSPHLQLVSSTGDISETPLSASLQEDEIQFNRSPRRRLPLAPQKIVVEGPPFPLGGNHIPLLLRMGGSMVMGGSAALAGHYTMLLSSVLFPVLSQKYSEKEKREYEARRVEKYGEYLAKKRQEILAEKEREEGILDQNYPELLRVLEYPASKKQLWERRKTDDDFLRLRLGTGHLPLMASVEYPERRFNMDDDVLEEELFELAERNVRLDGVPIMADFIEDFVCGIVGTRSLSHTFLSQLVMRLTILHSYDEVKTVFLLEPEDIANMEFIKFLPHTWDNQRSIRFLASNNREAYQIGEYLKQILEDDLKKPRPLKEILKERPYFVVFALSKRLFDAMELLKDVMQQETSCGVTVLTAFEDLPKECSILFRLSPSGDHTITYLKQIERKENMFRLDRYHPSAGIKSMHAIANISLRMVTQAYSLPKTLSFLEMFRVGRIEQLDPLKRWQESNPVTSLAAPVGIATDGSPFFLDLHQKFQGPHGLVAGMTGSGKSEFLITYILSMAVNFHPNEVAFVLIDYKGGGLTGAFVDESRKIRLPHLAGTITNLDGATIRRSLLSIQSELTRRQKIFQEVKTISDEGTMDIYSYQRLYRNGLVSEPLPHLFIISDEFAELKTQQPEFMDQLISIARIGRSLGIHLILATQKPAGVVNEQIRSNTKFRVCLKVQDRTDSMDMLKRPEAAELKETGRFYLQVGYNEFFALGQSAWSGAPYEPQDEVVVQRDDSVQFLDLSGQTLLSVKPAPQKPKPHGAQLTAMVKYLSDLAAKQGLASKDLWLPSLPPQLDLEALSCAYPPSDDTSAIQTCLGLLDDPENQAQYPLLLDLQHSKHLLVVGEAGSGKTTLLQSLLLSLSQRYSSEQFQFYILDYSSRMLNLFRTLPHCGAVLGEEDIPSLDAFFSLISSIIRSRKQLFSALEVNSYDAANTISPLPFVLICIDDLSGLKGSKLGEKHLFQLDTYLKEAANYGIRYLITCDHLNTLTSRLKQAFGERLCLHMNDKYAYGEALNCRVSYLPPDLPGRGLFSYQERPLELQIARYASHLEETQRLASLKQVLHTLSVRYANAPKARRLPVLSDTATYQDFSEQFQPGRIPLGYARANGKPVALPLKQFSVLSVYLGNPLGTVPIMENLLYAAKREKMDVWLLRRQENSVLTPEADTPVAPELYHAAKQFTTEASQVNTLWKTLAAEMAVRKETYLSVCAELGLTPAQKDSPVQAFPLLHKRLTPLLLFIEDFDAFCQAADLAATMVFRQIFQIAAHCHVYTIACFHPKKDLSAPEHSMYASLDPNQPILLFGGQFHQQTLCSLSEDDHPAVKVDAFNHGLMRYRQNYHPIQMPCGELPTETIDEDDVSIF